MTYSEAVAYIHSLLVFGMKPGLSRISALLSELGDPQNDLKFVHVAGTNGKGTTSNMLSRILVEAGYKTGLFTSPYVFSFCERIQVNHQNISESALAETVSIVRDAIERLNRRGIVPTEFEAITAAALLYFKNAGCDIAVMEVGLGGRFDSTNIIPCPEVCVITSISLDHTKVLGDTIAKIAFEKAGIIKEGGVTVTTNRQEFDALQVIQNTAAEKHNRLVVADVNSAEVQSQTLGETVFSYGGRAYTMPLTGLHQVENAVGAIEAARCLAGVTEENILNGIRKTVMHGRMEYLPGPPPVLLDGGHNPECGAALARVLRDFAPENVTAVIGMMEDKDTAHYLKAVTPYVKTIWFTKPKNPRAAAPEDLKAQIGDFPGEIFLEPNVPAAFENAKRATPNDGLVLVCGSFYLLSDLGLSIEN